MPFRYIAAKYAELKEEDDFRIEETGMQRVVRILTLPFRLIWAFGYFMVQAWSSSRNGFAFLRGMPAVATIFLFFAAIWLSETFVNRGGMAIARYAYHLNNSPDKPEYSLMFAERMIEMRPQERELLFQLGQSYERMNDHVEAYKIMELVASEESTATAKANVWLARHYSRQGILDGDKYKHEGEVEHYLQEALKSDPENLLALIGLANLYEDRGELKKTIGYLETVVSMEITRPVQIGQFPRLIKLQQEIGENESAEDRLQPSIIKILRIARAYPEQFEIWLTLVQCAVLLKDYDQANNIILEGLETAKDPKVRRRIAELASAVMIQNADDFPDLTDPVQYKIRLHRLCDAINRNVMSRDACLRLLDYAVLTEDTQERGIWLRDAIIECPNPAVIHILIGIQEIGKGNFVLAQEQWRIAEHESPAAALIVNFLIDVATNERPEDFENLMDMVTVAIELFAKQPGLYLTRAKFLIKEGRIDEAIKDLKFTIGAMPRSVVAHKNLIKCYELKNDKEAADQQREALEDILVSLDVEERKRVEAILDRM